MLSTLKANVIQCGVESPIYSWVRGGSESKPNDASYRLILGCPTEDGVDGNEIITVNPDKSIIFSGAMSIKNAVFASNSISGTSLKEGTITLSKLSSSAIANLVEAAQTDASGRSFDATYIKFEPYEDLDDPTNSTRNISYCLGLNSTKPSPTVFELWIWDGDTKENDVDYPSLTDYTLNLAKFADTSYLGLTGYEMDKNGDYIYENNKIKEGTLAQRLASTVESDMDLKLKANKFVELVTRASELMTPFQKERFVQSSIREVLENGVELSNHNHDTLYTNMFTVGTEDGTGERYTKIATVKLIGNSCQEIQLLMAAPGNFGGTHMGTYLISFSSRGCTETSGNPLSVVALDKPTSTEPGFGYKWNDTDHVYEFWLRQPKYSGDAKCHVLTKINSYEVGVLEQTYTNPSPTWVTPSYSVFTNGANFTGAVSATSFSGDGSALTKLNASNIKSGTLAKERLAASGVGSGSYGPTANVSGYTGNSIKVPQITVDTYGRVTGLTNRTFTATCNVPPGAVIPFHGVRVSNRNPIFWGQSSADTNWLLCDGGSDGRGGTTPNLIGKMIRGSDVGGAGSTGGSNTVTIKESNLPRHKHTITVSNGGSHGHTGSASSAGGHGHTGSATWAGEHTHTRGSMNITGIFPNGNERNNFNPTGAFYKHASMTNTTAWDSTAYPNSIVFDASRSWEGETSRSGNHTHTISITSSGDHTHTVTVSNGGDHNHTATCEYAGGVESPTALTVTPPYYQLAYFVRLPY